jgi:hypothetical protein
MAATAEQLDPFAPESIANPYPVYRRLRESDPVYLSPGGAYLLTRYDDIVEVLRDPRFSSDPMNAAGREEAPGRRPLVSQVTTDPEGRPRVMLFADPPDHTRLRTIVNKAFTARTVEAMRPRIQALLDELLEPAADTGVMDVMEELAYPLPVIVICEMLGVPAQDRDSFKGWSRGIAGILDPIDPETAEARAMELAPSFIQLVQYFTNLIDERRQRPRDDLLSALIAAEEAGDKLSASELMGMCILLFIAGHETTMNLIGNGTLALLRNPDQLSALREDPSLVRNAAEELLRYDSPVQLTARTALEDLEVGGTIVRKSQQVVTLLGAANRDPAHFPDPDRLDLRRPDIRHLSFGGGHHFCLGAPLARVEGQVTFSTLARRFPGIALAAEPEYRPTFTLRGLKELRVALRG